MTIKYNKKRPQLRTFFYINRNEKVTFAIYDLLGRERIKTTVYGLVNKATINVNTLETGVYLYMLQKQDKTNYSGKLLIE